MLFTPVLSRSLLYNLVPSRSQLQPALLPPVAYPGVPSFNPLPFCVPEIHWTFLFIGDSPFLALSWFYHWVNYIRPFFPQWFWGNVKRQMCAQPTFLKGKHILYSVNSVTPFHIISERLHHALTSNIQLRVGSKSKPEIEIQFTDTLEVWMYHFFSCIIGSFVAPLYHGYGQDLEKVLPLNLVWTQERKHWLPYKDDHGLLNLSDIASLLVTAFH